MFTLHPKDRTRFSGAALDPKSRLLFRDLRDRCLALPPRPYEMPPAENPRQLRSHMRRGEIWSLTGGHCLYCRRPLPLDFHLDHLVPKAKGGEHKRNNIAPACGTCNRSKGVLAFDVFALMVL